MATLWVKTKKKLRVMKRYVVHSIMVGFVLGLASTLYIGFLENFKVQPLLITWVSWYFAMSFVLPAILDDEFSSA